MRFPNEPSLSTAASAALSGLRRDRGGRGPGAALRVPRARLPACPRAVVACDPSPLSSGCIGKPQGPRGRLCTRLASLPSSPARAVSVRSDPGPQVLPGAAYPGLPGHRSACPAAPSTALPLFLSSPAPAPAGPRPCAVPSPPGPGPGPARHWPSPSGKMAAR